MVRRGSAPAMSSTAPPSRAATIWEPCSAAEVLAATAWITARARTARLRRWEAGQEGNRHERLADRPRGGRGAGAARVGAVGADRPAIREGRAVPPGPGHRGPRA